MKFIEMTCGTVLKSKKNGVLGWVMLTTNNKYVFSLTRKETITKRELFDTEEEAKTALLEAVKK